MSPLTILDALGASSTDGGATVVVRTPSRVRVGLHLLAFVAWPPASSPHDFEADGWDVLGVDAVGIAVLRRACSAEEPSSYSFATPMAILAVAAGVADNGAAVDLKAAAIAAGGPIFTATGGTLQSYSDAAFSIFYAASSSGFDAPANTMLEIHGDAGSLLVLWEMPEAAGVIGNRSATLAGGSPCNGAVAQVVLAAAPPARAPRWDSIEAVSFGLPTVGV